MAVTVVTGDSAMQLMAFAAPRTEGIWDDVRGEIRNNLAGNGSSTRSTARSAASCTPRCPCRARTASR